MKSKLKKTLIPLILMIILDLGAYYYVGGSQNFGAGLNAYLGLIFACGLLTLRSSWCNYWEYDL